jgi:hypothetical protein
MRADIREQAADFVEDYQALNSQPEVAAEDDAPKVDRFAGYEWSGSFFDTPDYRAATEDRIESELSLIEHVMSGYMTQDVPVLFGPDGEPFLWATLRTQRSLDEIIMAKVIRKVTDSFSDESDIAASNVAQCALLSSRILEVGTPGNMRPYPPDNDAPNTPASADRKIHRRDEFKRVLNTTNYMIDNVPPPLQAALHTQVRWLDDRVSSLWKSGVMHGTVKMS